jgi:hypothetical protein
MPKELLGYLNCTNAPFSRNKAVMITPKTSQRNQKAHMPVPLRLAWAQVLADQARKATDHCRDREDRRDKFFKTKWQRG